jgi:hypothetical protein
MVSLARLIIAGNASQKSQEKTCPETSRLSLVAASVIHVCDHVRRRGGTHPALFASKIRGTELSLAHRFSAASG